jgi:hypothetical protein
MFVRIDTNNDSGRLALRAASTLVLAARSRYQSQADAARLSWSR